MQSRRSGHTRVERATFERIVREHHQAVWRAAELPSAEEIAAPNEVLRARHELRHEVHVVVIQFKTQLRLRVGSAAEDSVEDGALRFWRMCLGEHDDYFRVFEKETADGGEVEYLPHVPLRKDAVSEGGAAAVIEEVILLEQAQQTILRERLHAVMQEQIGRLLVRQALFSVGVLIFLVCLCGGPFVRSRAERRIPHDDADIPGQLLLPHLLEKARLHEGLSLEGGEQPPRFDDRLRRQFLAHREAETEGREFHRRAVYVCAAHALHELAQHVRRRGLPAIILSPVEHEPLEGFDQKNARAAGGIEHNLVALLQTVHALQRQSLLQHQPGKERRRIDAGRFVLHEKLIDVADEFHRQVVEGVEPPERLLPAGFHTAFDELREFFEMCRLAKLLLLLLQQGEDVSVEPLRLQMRQ